MITQPPGPFDPTWDSLTRYQVPEWYLDAKFGIFIHWGVYSVPAFGNEWYPRQMYLADTAEHRHHVETYGAHSRFGYKDFVAQFRAERYDPAEWAALFAESGARYVVPVAEHHDGFQMYASALSEWNAARKGPGRDVVAQLADAVRKAGMVFGVSSHRAEHWWFFNGGQRFDSDVRDPANAALYGPAAPDGTQPDEAFLDDWLARCCELVDLFRPQVFWFDWWIEQPAFRPYLRRFAAYYYNRAMAWGQGVAINYKHTAFPQGAAVYDVERGQLGETAPYFWQTDTSISKGSWGYVGQQDYKTADEIIGDLCDIVSKNGCLLLNVGPRPDGTIPEPEQDALRAIGRWLAVNGEAIYGTRPWRVYGEGPTQVVAGEFADTRRAAFTAEDIRYTCKGGTVYAIALAWPDTGRLTLRSLAAGMGLAPFEVCSVEVLGSDAPAAWQRDAAGLHVALPPAAPAGPGCALRIRPAN